MEKLKAWTIDFLKKSKTLRIIVRQVVWGLRKIQYQLKNGRIKVDNKIVLFETFMGRQYGCNPKAIYEEMLKDERFNDYKFVWAFREPQRAADFDNLKRAHIVRHRSSEYFRYAASAKVIITNSELDYRLTPKKEQVFFQTWHGTPLKRLRCDIDIEKGNANNSLEEIKLRNDMDVVRYEYFLSPSEFASDKFVSAFNLKLLNKEQIILEAGYPRNDILINYNACDVARIKAELGIPEGKKVILYAPTFRDNRHAASQGGYIYDLNLDFEKLKSRLGDEYVVIFRTHYFIANQFDFGKYERFVFNASHLDDITELYIISDILVTDYSSVFFDYANLRRKIVFYMYDLEQYQNDIRGFYIPLDELPGDIVTTEDALIEVLRADDFEYDERYSRFNKKYNYLDDGKAARRVIEEIFNL